MRSPQHPCHINKFLINNLKGGRETFDHSCEGEREDFRSLIYTESKVMLDQKLSKLKSGDTFTDKELPAIGIGIAIPETKKIFRFKESIDMKEQSLSYPKVL